MKIIAIIRSCATASICFVTFFSVVADELAVELHYKDPTRPLMYSVNSQHNEKKIELQLQAIYLSESSEFAIINGERLSRGQVINGWRVHKIHSSSVQLITREGSKTLQLLESVRK